MLTRETNKKVFCGMCEDTEEIKHVPLRVFAGVQVPFA